MAEGTSLPLHAFNFDTMSGVYPGTRTQIWQRLRLLPNADNAHPACWALLLWYDDPPACVLLRQDTTSAQLDAAPLLRLELADAALVQPRLTAALAALGWRLFACGACAHWQPGAAAGAQARQTTADGLTLGACTLRRAHGDRSAPDSVPAPLQAQSLLALACSHWVEGVAAPGAAMLPVARLPMIAETSTSKLKPLARWRLRVARRLRPAPAPASLADVLSERSGVGAGTDPCAACQGRIANLGALAVASPEGDKETFSLWRCRVCHTLYLSDWVDRWERVDSLETEETIYRVAPVEAAELLTLFVGVHAGDHPERRHERDVQRDWIHAQMAARTPLRHIIKQGR